MPVNDVLLGIIRVLTIILLVVFIVTGYYSLLIVMDFQSTVHTRLANGEFPLPTNGINIGDQSGGQTAGQTSQSQGQSNTQFDLSGVKDPKAQNYLQSFINYMNNNDKPDAYTQLNQLDVYLAQKGDASSQAKLQELKQALDSGNDNTSKARLQELIALLSK